MTQVGEIVLLKILDAALNAAAVGVRREDVLDKVNEQLAAGVKPEDIPAAIVKLRDEALSRAEAKVKASQGGGAP